MLRARPACIIMLTLLPGGTVVSATDCYLAIRRIRRDLSELFRYAAAGRGKEVAART